MDVQGPDPRGTEDQVHFLMGDFYLNVSTILTLL